ncbi:MAG: LuxR C-terminal-related transcriptional regulator [Chloroflexaceae bacterium]|nr:LuxR C-terminal-related transcriptional regulator [Chloroflexaceae bacterium]
MTNNVQISEREREILRLVAQGATNQQIADQLDISINTVKVHLRNIFGKIGVMSRTEATLYAIRNGIVSVAEPVEAGARETEAPTLVVTDDEVSSGARVAAPLFQTDSPALPLPAPAEPPAPPVTGQPAPEQSAWRWPLVWLVVGVALVVVAIVGWLIRDTLRPSPGTAALPTVAAVEPTPANRLVEHTPVPYPRQSFALLASASEGRLYVIGGAGQPGALPTLDRYDPQTRLWVSLADKLTPVSAIRAAELRGRIYVPGGERSDGTVSDQLEAYDPREQRWYALRPLPAPRSRYGLAVWEGKLYLLGGWDGRQMTADVFVYDPALDEWSSGPGLPDARQYASASVVSDHLYVIGGEAASGPLRDSLRLEVDANTARWQFLPPVPQAIGRPQTIALLNSLLVFDDQAQAVWQYDGASDAWVPYPIPADIGDDATVALLNTSLFFVAGEGAPEPGAVTEYRVLYTIFVPGTGGRSSAP